MHNKITDLRYTYIKVDNINNIYIYIYIYIYNLYYIFI